MLRGKRHHERESRRRLRGEPVPFLERWIMTILCDHDLSEEKTMNQVFAPIPTNCALYAVTEAISKKKRDLLREDYQFNTNWERELRKSLTSHSTLPPSAMFAFVKIVVDDDEKTVVSKGFMTKMKELTQNDTVLACNPQRTKQLLRALTGGAVDGPRSSHGFSSVYATAGLKARWCGKATPASPFAFASTYSIKRKHPCIQLETEAKVIHMYECEVWEIPTMATETVFNLVLIRPTFIGELLRLKRRLTGEDLTDILNGLARAKSNVYKLLIPILSIVSQENLLSVWLQNSVHSSRENSVIPPINAIWSVAKLSIGLDGIGVKDLKLGVLPLLPTSFRKYRREDALVLHHTPVAASFDSSFIFVISQNGKAPLLAGCYAGNPNPPRSAFSIECPAEIMKKPPIKVIKKPKPKMTKRQKRVQKIRRSRLERREQMLLKKHHENRKETKK
ncbi:hypothetical protein RB195_009812 [Necator americanus]|uniref:Serpin domain-containing protein n=1 Tax=Necator americanus TaxID=51031 RepID=A0ABR1CWA1_NECAM